MAFKITNNGLTLSAFRDGHVHLRQEPLLESLIAQMLAGGCSGGVFMPNTKPPIQRVSGENDAQSFSIEGYRRLLKRYGGDGFDTAIVPLYLTAATTAEMIETGAAQGLLKAVKYYPPHGTTNSEHGTPLLKLLGGPVLKAMEASGVVLCIHGEQHQLNNQEWFDAQSNAEHLFYEETMPRLVELHPRLKIVCEHLSTRTAVEFVDGAGANVFGTITPQHLLYTVGDLLKAMQMHLYCMPLVKYQEDRLALCRAVTRTDNRKYFAGTDSAPHLLANKAIDCGCAAGAYFGKTALPMYAMAFENAGVDILAESGARIFHTFVIENFNRCYGTKDAARQIELKREPSNVSAIDTPLGLIKPLALGMVAGATNVQLPWSVS